MNKEICKNFQSFMFACGDCNIIIEAEDKKKAIDIFESEFTMRFNGDWKVFTINTRVTIDGEYTRY